MSPQSTPVLVCFTASGTGVRPLPGVHTPLVHTPLVGVPEHLRAHTAAILQGPQVDVLYVALDIAFSGETQATQVAPMPPAGRLVHCLQILRGAPSVLLPHVALSRGLA